MTTQLHSVTGPESFGLGGTSTLLTVCARERTSAEARFRSVTRQLAAELLDFATPSHGRGSDRMRPLGYL